MPSYAVKRFKKNPRQKKALDWLTASGKDKFDAKLASLLAQWGVKETHKGTCILCPEDWSSLDPVHIMDLFDADKCPIAGSKQLSYQYSDHASAFQRAVAWFQDKQWPRNGIELDNFVGDGLFKPMDVSHLCHHDDWIIHITYKPAHVNQDWKSCCIEAQSLCQQRLPVLECCDKHNPPCLMQVSSPAISRNIYSSFLACLAVNPRNLLCLVLRLVRIKGDAAQEYRLQTAETSIPHIWIPTFALARF